MKESTIEDLPIKSVNHGGVVDDVSQINDCCMRVIESLAHINTMMVCNDCKQIIKTFKEERAYRNYLLFCKGRSRSVNTGIFRGQWITIFASCDA